ncbi:MAG: hypothetical protein EA357_02315 [Micavibrio sp.]|nr:MAG: hypothetical protein EA357_02315 [Micavibrio sp.]
MSVAVMRRFHLCGELKTEINLCVSVSIRGGAGIFVFPTDGHGLTQISFFFIAVILSGAKNLLRVPKRDPSLCGSG